MYNQNAQTIKQDIISLVSIISISMVTIFILYGIHSGVTLSNITKHDITIIKDK